MTLDVDFECTVNVHKKDAEYSGDISVKPASNGYPHKYHFLCLNPYGGKEAEIAIYYDEARLLPFVESVGNPKQSYNLRTGRNISHFDLTALGDDPVKVGMAYVLIQIIMEAIYNADVELLNGSQLSNLPYPQVKFSRYWQQTFTGEAEKYAYGFLKVCEAP